MTKLQKADVFTKCMNVHRRYPFTLLLKHTKIPKHLQFQKKEVLFSCLKHIDQLEDVMMLHPAARERIE